MYGTQARIARLTRRLALTGITLLLLVVLLYLLLTPFLHPNTYFVYLVANDTTQIVPQAFTLEDYAYLDPLSAAIKPPPDNESQIPILPLETPTMLGEHLQAIDNWDIGRNEALIVYLKAHGLVIDGDPYLLCDNFHPHLEPEGVFPVSTLLQQIRNCRAKTKLIVIDTGQNKLDRRLGTIGDDFPHALRAAVSEANDADMWVLHSHSNLQAAQTSRALGRSVFGFMFARGLKGAADLNNDQLIALDELSNYLRLSVDQWSREYGAGAASQSPKLFRATTDETEPSSYPLLISVANIPQEAREEDITEAMTTAQSPQRQSELSRSVRQHMSYFVEEKQRQLTSAFRPDYRTEEILGKVGGTAKRQATQNTTAEEAAAPTDGTADPNDEENPDAESTGEESLASADAELDADSVEINLQYKPIVAELLTELWTIRDDLLASDATGPRIVDFAPDLWREFEWELLLIEQRHRSGLSANQIALAEQLRDLKTSLETMAAGETPRRRREPNVIDRAIARKPVYDPRGEQINSLALAEVLADYGNPFSEEELAAIADFRKAITGNDRTKFDEWLAKPALKEIAHYYEVILAKRLGEQLELSWPLIKLAVETRLLSEKIVAMPTVDAAWFRQEIETTDTVRLAAERMLVDQIGHDWQTEATRDLRQARDEYRAIGARANQLDELIQLQHEMLSQAPHYVHWRGMVEGDANAPTHADVTSLLSLLSKASNLIEGPNPGALPALFRLHDSLLELKARLAATISEQSLQDLIDNPTTGDAARLEAMLSTPLLSAPLRELAATNAISVEGRLMADFDVTLELIKLGQLGRLTKQEWDRFLAQAKLEVQLVGLVLFDPDERETRLKKLTSLMEQIEQQDSAIEGIDEDKLFATHRSMADTIARVYLDLPNRLRRATLANADLTNITTRQQRMTRLAEAQRGLRLLDPRDTARVEGGTLVRQMIAAHWYDHLAWQNRRMLQQIADAPARERSFLLAAAERYRRIAAEIPSQPSLADHIAPGVELSGPDFVSLASTESEEAVIRVRKRASATNDIWLLLAYDPNLIEVRTSADRVIYRLEDLAPRIRAQAEQAAAKHRMMALSTNDAPATQLHLVATNMARAARYPVRPNLAEYPRSIEVAPGDAAELRLQVKRQAGKASDAKLLVKAINADTYVRHEIIVRLPGRETIELSGSPTRTDWEATSRGLVLHPMPNRDSEFPLYLKNHGDRDRVVDLEWLAPEQRITAILPSGEQTPEIADEILARLGDLKPWKQIDGIDLPTGGEPIAIAPAAMPTADAPPAAGEEAAGSEQPPAAAAPNDPTDDQLLDHGLLAVITDRDTGKVSLRHVDFAPQRPRRYVEAVVGYNSTTQQVEVSVKPLNRFALGPKGIPVELSFAEPLPPGAEARLTGVITATNNEVRMFADVPPAFRRQMTAFIHVDGYPRAFAYSVPIGPQSRDIPEQTDLFRVSIESPTDSAAYKTPIDHVPVEVHVDAPRGSFPPDYSDDLVEIGIDIDRDREFRDEKTYQFHSDRLVVVTATELLPSGAIRVNTSVTDFKLDLPTDGLSNAIANLLARVKVGNFVSWSETVPIILDGSAPRVERVEMNPGRSVEVGKELEISIWGADANLSGMAKVEIGLGSQSGEFAAKPAPVEATPIANVRWSGTLKLEGLEAGLHTVLIRTTDAVGNVSKMHKESIQIVPAGSMPAEVETKTGATIAGVVMYGNDQLGGATVELIPLDVEAEKIEPINTGEDARFRFKDVPPGKYTLAAKGLFRNKLRKSSEEVTVEPGETGLQLFTLQPR